MTQQFDIVVLGGGESGVGAALLAQQQGFTVLVSDSGNLQSRYITRLEQAGIPYEHGNHTEALVLAAKEVIKSPGIADKAPLIRLLHEQGTPVISEIEFALRYSKAKTVAITGSNGKTTTTLLCYHLLKEAGLSVGLAGNVGHSLAALVASGQEPDWYVLELSSFQLDGMFRSRINIAVLLNITPDHLDRYQYQLALYAASKFRITQNQTTADYLITVPGASPEVADRLASMAGPAQQIRIGTAGPMATSTSDTSSAPYLAEDALVFPAYGWRLPFDQLPLRGVHNHLNILCAMQAALLTGADAEKVLAALASFRNAPHRLQEAGKLAGVLWVNDSKATNVDAVFYALQSFQQPLVLILGGVDKGNDYGQIRELVLQKVKALVFMGTDNSPLERYFADDSTFSQLPKQSCHSLAEACEAARSFATDGDVVLLSPACASFDLFRNYEDRGEQFMAWVAAQQTQ